MRLIASVLTGFVALSHLGILVLEMFFWDHPVGRKIFAMTPEVSAASATLAKNQGLYNGFLAAMLIWGLVGESASAVVSPRAALWGGIIIGLGFAVLRLSTAEDLPEAIYACGLSAIEVGTLVFADAGQRRVSRA